MKFLSFMMNHSYCKTTSNHCMFVKKFYDDNFIILLLYMGEILIVSHDINKIDNLKRDLSKSFVIMNLEWVKQTLGMRISLDKKNHKI